MNVKINSEYEFPELLDLNPYSFKENMKDQDATIVPVDETETKDFSDLMLISDDDYIYRLSGVCIHRGTADHGHYWSYINTERG